jgi:hypothetical protein
MPTASSIKTNFTIENTKNECVEQNERTLCVLIASCIELTTHFIVFSEYIREPEIR